MARRQAPRDVSGHPPLAPNGSKRTASQANRATVSRGSVIFGEAAPPPSLTGESTLSTKPDLPVLHFESQAELEAWLDANHQTAPGLWLQFAKKGSPHTSVTYDEAVESALCFGWIDGQARSLDEHFWLQRFTPRTKRSSWSEINCERATALIAAGRMRPAGRAAVEAAKRNGRWDRAYSARNMTVPNDLQRRLHENPKARAFFESLSSSNRFAFLYRIHDAKRPETRARRIEQFVSMLEKGKKID